MKISRLKEIIKEELLKEGMYGEEDSFIPLKVDKYAPNTRIGLKDTIESLQGAAYGFSLIIYFLDFFLSFSQALSYISQPLLSSLYNFCNLVPIPFAHLL